MTSQDKYQAFEKLMRRLVQSASGTVAYGTAILAIISLIPGIQLPAAFAALIGGIGINIISNILERMANGEEISDEELFKQVEVATEDLRKTLTKEEFFSAYGHLLGKFQDNHREHKEITQKIENIIKAIDFNKEAALLPATNVDIKARNLQISLGDNSTNIQNTYNFDTQIIQQAPQLNKVAKKNKKGSLQLSDVKDIPKNIRDGSRIRFLDALDSARFSSQAVHDNAQMLSVSYVKAQFVLAMISGDSIVVTENQLFDSLGFLETFDELHHAVKSLGLEVELPINVALRATNSTAYEAVANSIGNESFVLTLWGNLDKNTERRKLWAEYINNKQKPTDEVVLMEEKPLVDKLWVALEYFNPERCVPADNIPSEFSERIKRVVELRDEDLDDLYTGISMDVEQRKYFNTKDEVEAAKEIRAVLFEIQEKAGEIKTRSLILRELLNYDNQELRDGVVELTNGIYNQTLGIATRATLIQSSTFPQRVNKYVTAGYSLSTFVQDTSNLFNFYINWEIFSFDYFKNLEGLSDPRRKSNLTLILEKARENTPWMELIEMQRDLDWQTSLHRFRNNLSKLQSVEKTLSIGSLASIKRKKLESERLNYQKELKRNWSQHIAIVSRFATNDCWKITPTEISFNHPRISYSIRISYSFLKTKIDMEGDDGYKIWRNSQSFKGRMDDRAELSG